MTATTREIPLLVADLDHDLLHIVGIDPETVIEEDQDHRHVLEVHHEDFHREEMMIDERDPDHQGEMKGTPLYSFSVALRSAKL